PEVLVRIARCQNMLGRSKPASEILDAVLARHPGHALALRTRGEIALMNGQVKEAERWLRQALAAMPDDHLTNYALHKALKGTGKDEEARIQGDRDEMLKKRLDQLSELSTRKMSERPHDPALHCELGKLLLSMGHKDLGEQWLLSALNQDPR